MFQRNHVHIVTMQISVERTDKDMNNTRRKELNKAVELLNGVIDAITEAQGIVETCKDEEEEYRDNMPENLQNSDRYYASDSACDALNDAYDQIEDILEKIDDAVSNIETATE